MSSTKFKTYLTVTSTTVKLCVGELHTSPYLKIYFTDAKLNYFTLTALA